MSTPAVTIAEKIAAGFLQEARWVVAVVIIVAAVAVL